MNVPEYNEPVESFIDVPDDLHLQGLDRFEPLFCSDAPLEGQIDLDSIEVAGEIDDVGLGNEIATISKSGSKTDVRDDRKRSAFRRCTFTEAA